MTKLEGRTRAFTIFTLLWVLNALLRVVFGVLSITEGSLLDVPVTLLIHQILVVMFFLLGAGGFLSAYGLWKLERWGLQGVVALSIVTIGFDLWGITIQFTAAMGFIIPVLALTYLGFKMEKTEMRHSSKTL